MPRSLKVRQDHVNRVKLAVIQNGFPSQRALSEDMGLALSTVSNFLTGRPVDRATFADLCTRLGLEPNEIANYTEQLAVNSKTQPQKEPLGLREDGLVIGELLERPHLAQASVDALEIDQLVHLIRKNIYDNTQARCGYIRVLDMSQPFGLDAIYTTVNIYKSIRGRQRRALSDLLHQPSITYLEQIQGSRISGLAAVEQYAKLIIFGQPGSGKTTFLKWLAMQCNEGQLWADSIPVFISAKTFAEFRGQPDLVSYIHKQWAESGVTSAQTEILMQQGRASILLDGLDEVREMHHNRVLQEISEFSSQFHRCPFVITCRIAAQDYTFEQFTEVEMADFDDQQMTTFVTQWFESRNEPTKIEQFLGQLQAHQRIRDLATNPLLLTLLCLVFQDSTNFPANRSELYREGVEILLKNWDAKRKIERDALDQSSQLYQKFTLSQKEALLCQIAFTTFERGQYFFKRQTIEQCVTDFLHSLPTISAQLEYSKIDGAAVLRSVEAQHGLLVERARGIYSFSHLTFHEYLTAKQIVDKPEDQLAETLETLVHHVTHKPWREVFLLTASLLRSADVLLLKMKAQIDRLISSDAKIQRFLKWLDERARSIVSSYKLATVKSHYAYLVTYRHSARALTSATDNSPNMELAKATAFFTSNDVTSARLKLISIDLPGIITTTSNVFAIVTIVMDVANVLSDNMSSFNIISSANTISNNIKIAIDRAIALASDSVLKHSLQSINNQLPDPNSDLLTLTQWWKVHGHAWVQQLRNVQIEYRNLTYNWQFSQAQIALLDQYFEANILLVECLKGNGNVSQAVRDQIDATLLST